MGKPVEKMNKYYVITPLYDLRLYNIDSQQNMSDPLSVQL